MTTNPTIFELCEEFHLSLAKVRRMEKRYPHWFKASTSQFDEIRATLANGDALAVWQLVQLIENPGELLNLGKYAHKAERALAELGNPQAQVAPKDVAANLMEAAKNEPEAVQILVDWLKGMLPAEPVTHAFIATRLLLGVPESIRKYEGPRIPRALLNSRQSPSFAGYWRTVKELSRNVTYYQKLELDL